MLKCRKKFSVASLTPLIGVQIRAIRKICKFLSLEHSQQCGYSIPFECHADIATFVEQQYLHWETIFKFTSKSNFTQSGDSLRIRRAFSVINCVLKRWGFSKLKNLLGVEDFVPLILIRAIQSNVPLIF